MIVLAWNTPAKFNASVFCFVIACVPVSESNIKSASTFTVADELVTDGCVNTVLVAKSAVRGNVDLSELNVCLPIPHLPKLPLG